MAYTKRKGASGAVPLIGNERRAWNTVGGKETVSGLYLTKETSNNWFPIKTKLRWGQAGYGGGESGDAPKLNNDTTP